MLWSEGKPSLLRVPLSITRTQGPQRHSLPQPPQANTAGPDPPKRCGALRNGSQAPPAALHQRRTTASHGCGEAGHTWGPARGKSWPAASPRQPTRFCCPLSHPVPERPPAAESHAAGHQVLQE